VVAGGGCFTGVATTTDGAESFEYEVMNLMVLVAMINAFRVDWGGSRESRCQLYTGWTGRENGRDGFGLSVLEWLGDSDITVQQLTLALETRTAGCGSFGEC
jgi:hypothetical protein